MKDSKIEWCDHTFNPWIGCTKVSPGCTNCYAEAQNKRWRKGANWGKGAPRQRTGASYWRQPLQWNADAERADRPPRVFCASLADWLDDEVPISWLADLLALIAATPYLDWLLLTKRPQNWKARLDEVLSFCCTERENLWPGEVVDDWLAGRPASNVWIGTTVEDQARADLRIPQLVEIPARVRFLSCEPLLGPVSLLFSAFQGGSFSAMEGISWVICGGESGREARPMNDAWARNLRNECEHSGVPFFFKQWGEYCEAGWKVGKKSAGRVLDGVTHDEFPK